MQSNICGNCVNWFCTDPKELTGFCRLTLSGINYEEHGECKEYQDKFGRLCRTNTKLNEAIKTISEVCKANNICTQCPMNYNCNEQPAKWKETKEGAE